MRKLFIPRLASPDRSTTVQAPEDAARVPGVAGAAMRRRRPAVTEEAA